MTAALAAIPAVVAGSRAALDTYHLIAADPHLKARLLIRGAGGSGKSALISAIRNILIAAEIPASESVGEFDPAIHSALLVDDAHQLSTTDLLALTTLAHRDDVLLVVATRQRHVGADVAMLLRLMERAGRTVDLEPLTEHGVVAASRAQFGIAVSRTFAGTVMRLTDGLSFLVNASLGAADVSFATTSCDSSDRIADAVRVAIADRLHRLDRNVLQAMAVASIGAELDELNMATLLGIDPQRARGAIAEAETCGMIRRTHELGSMVTAELAKVLGRYQLERLSRSLFDMHALDGSLEPQLASRLADSGVRDRRLSEFLLAEAEAHTGSDLALAEQLYQSAIVSGARFSDLSIRRAEVAFQLGRFDEALTIADASWEHVQGPALTSAARVAASAWCTRGMVGRGADVYNWIGPQRVGEDGPIAALLLTCAGRPDVAAEMISAASPRPPTSEVSGNRLLAQALLASLDRPEVEVLGQFVRSLAVLGTPARGVYPDSPAAVTAIAALHAGDLRRARKVLHRVQAAAAVNSPGVIRHRLLLAWTTMLEGDILAAATELSGIVDNGGLSPRDRLFADALRVGLARRRADTGQLHAALTQARETVDECCVDLLSLLPVGEIWAAASRVGRAHEVQHLVDDAFTLLAHLGDPPFWSSALHWFGVTVAIQSDSPDDLTNHAHALRAAAPHNEYAAALASAGRTWVRILGGELDLANIADAAAGLNAIGLGWDGANLASRAALRCTDSQASAELLQIARCAGQPNNETTPETGALSDNLGALNQRQREVAALLVQGLTYKGVGERLFISPKTVEYHVTKIKRQIGTESRSELLSRLHALNASKAS